MRDESNEAKAQEHNSGAPIATDDTRASRVTCCEWRERSVRRCRFSSHSEAVILYADTSWWIAYKCEDDAGHETAVRLFDLWPDAVVVWTPWQRLEVFNSFRQLERTGMISSGKARQLIRLLEQEVKLGYWPHVEFDWLAAVRTACELSAELGLSIAIRSMDLFHVAVAIEVGADAILTLDGDQQTFADAAGLRVVSLHA